VRFDLALASARTPHARGSARERARATLPLRNDLNVSETERGSWLALAHTRAAPARSAQARSL
jgi:hypothetical protein